VIPAYNDLAIVRDPAGGEALPTGLEAFIPLQAQIPPRHNLVSVGHRRLEAASWYLVRRSNEHYDVSQIAADSGRALVATRSIRTSPFPQERDAVYFAATTQTRCRRTTRPGLCAPRSLKRLG
jgi:hypothetical protein